MEQSESINELALAVSKAQAVILAAKKDSDNPFFKSSYADLASVWEACRKPLTDNGLCVIQTTSPECDGRVMIITTLAHSSGQWVRGKLAIKPVKDDPQSLGSAITYGRRYALAAITGVAPDDDDDGEKAMGRDKDNPKPQSKAGTLPKTTQNPPEDVISEAQRKRLYAIAKGHKWADEAIKGYLLRQYHVEHTAQIKKTDYEAICAYFGKPPQDNRPADCAKNRVDCKHATLDPATATIMCVDGQTCGF